MSSCRPPGRRSSPPRCAAGSSAPCKSAPLVRVRARGAGRVRRSARRRRRARGGVFARAAGVPVGVTPATVGRCRYRRAATGKDQPGRRPERSRDAKDASRTTEAGPSRASATPGRRRTVWRFAVSRTAAPVSVARRPSGSSAASGLLAAGEGVALFVLPYCGRGRGGRGAPPRRIWRARAAPAAHAAGLDDTGADAERGRVGRQRVWCRRRPESDEWRRTRRPRQPVVGAGGGRPEVRRDDRHVVHRPAGVFQDGQLLGSTAAPIAVNEGHAEPRVRQ